MQQNNKLIQPNLTFRVSSGLKDIIGRDLIFDANIAVFELVKNSFSNERKFWTFNAKTSLRSVM